MDIKQLIGETTDYDKKVALETKKPKSWCKSISAFANCYGGKLVFGVANDDALVGLSDAKGDAEKISEIIKTHLNPIPEFKLSFEKDNDKTFVIVEVMKGQQIPYYYEGDGQLIAFMRIGNESVPATPSQLRELVLHGSGESYDSLKSRYDFNNMSFTKLKSVYKQRTGNAFEDTDYESFGLVDEKGNLVDGDAILYIYGKYMKERGKLENNTVVTTVMSNFGLYKAFDEAGIGYAKTAVGDKYVYEYMTKNGCILGGEQSGHIIFSKYASTGDGILTSLKMMEVMMARKKKMSELLDGLTIYPQVLENVRVTDKKAAQDDADVQAAVKAVTEALGDTGRILVRESGTEPLLRVMVEAETEEVCRKYVDQVVDVVKAKGHIAS